MNAFVSAETIADAVACLREAGTPLPATVADLDDVALGRALWRMNADALAVNHDEEIEGYAAPAASDSAGTAREVAGMLDGAVHRERLA